MGQVIILPTTGLPPVSLPSLAMSAVPNGLFSIYSRVLDNTGEKLAITFNGINQYVTLQPLGSSTLPTQKVSDIGLSRIVIVFKS